MTHRSEIFRRKFLHISANTAVRFRPLLAPGIWSETREITCQAPAHPSKFFVFQTLWRNVHQPLFFFIFQKWLHFYAPTPRLFEMKRQWFSHHMLETNINHKSYSQSIQNDFLHLGVSSSRIPRFIQRCL